jgi:hypothetical protein
VDSIDPIDQRGDEAQAGEEISSGFIVAGCNGSKILQAGERSFDDIAQTIKFGGEWEELLAVAFVGNDRAGVLLRRRVRGFLSCARRASAQWLDFAPPFSCAARRAMRLDGRTIDHRERRGIATSNERREYTLPQTALAPPIISIEDRRIRPVSLGKCAPSAALAQPMDDPADDATIVRALRSSVDHRKMRLDRRPLLVIEPEIVRHESSLPHELESRRDAQFNWVRTLVLQL